jgi:hypothetical protein
MGTGRVHLHGDALGSPFQILEGSRQGERISGYATSSGIGLELILTADGELISTLDGRGNQGTWPTHLPMPWLLPIDHCLHSLEWDCVAREIGPETGSDHLPLLVSLALKPGVLAAPEHPAVTTKTSP